MPLIVLEGGVYQGYSFYLLFSLSCVVMSPPRGCVRAVYSHDEQLLADVSIWALQKGYLHRPYRCGNEQVFKIPLPPHS